MHSISNRATSERNPRQTKRTEEHESRHKGSAEPSSQTLNTRRHDMRRSASAQAESAALGSASDAFSR
jgi:hypothetical protein